MQTYGDLAITLGSNLEYQNRVQMELITRGKQAEAAQVGKNRRGTWAQIGGIISGILGFLHLEVNDEPRHPLCSSDLVH